MEARKIKLENEKEKLNNVKNSLLLLEKKKGQIIKTIETMEWELHHPVLNDLIEYLYLPLALLVLSYLNVHWCMKHKQLSYSGVCIRCQYLSKKCNNDSDDDDDDDGVNVCTWRLKGSCNFHVTEIRPNRFRYCIIPTDQEDELVFEEWRKIATDVGFCHRPSCTIHPLRLQIEETLENKEIEVMEEPLREKDPVGVHWRNKGLEFLKMYSLYSNQ